MIERLVDAALELSVVGSYSRIGYAVRSRLEGWTPPRRVDGRVALVTGAGSGSDLAAALPFDRVRAVQAGLLADMDRVADALYRREAGSS